MFQSAPLRIFIILFVVLGIVAISAYAYSSWLNTTQESAIESTTNTPVESDFSEIVPATNSTIEGYSPSLPPLATITPITSTQSGSLRYALSIEPVDNPNSITIQLESLAALYLAPETESVFTNQHTGWTELFNKQTSDVNSSFMRYGALVMPPIQVDMSNAIQPMFILTTDNPLSTEFVRGTVEIIDENDVSTFGRIVIDGVPTTKN